MSALQRPLIVSFLLWVALAANAGSLWAWAPFHRTAPIEGRITDVTTGEPIENAIVYVKWEQSEPALVDMMTGTADTYTQVTDKEGRFYIPSNITFHFLPLLIIGSSFDGILVSVTHPLYEGKKRGVDYREKKKWVYRNYFEDGSKLIKKGRRYQLNIRLLSIEEKLKKEMLTHESKNEIMSDDIFDYYKRAKKKKIPNEILAFYRNELIRIIFKYPGYIRFPNRYDPVNPEKQFADDVNNLEIEINDILYSEKK